MFVVFSFGYDHHTKTCFGYSGAQDATPFLEQAKQNLMLTSFRQNSSPHSKNVTKSLTLGQLHFRHQKKTFKQKTQVHG